MNKHLIVLGMAVLLICVGLSGCTNEDKSQDGTDASNDLAKFVGTWKSIERDREYTFYSNSSYLLSTTEYGGVSTSRGTYEVKDERLTLHGLAVGPFMYSFSNNDNTLTLTDVDDGDSEVYTKQQIV